MYILDKNIIKIRLIRVVVVVVMIWVCFWILLFLLLFSIVNMVVWYIIMLIVVLRIRRIMKVIIVKIVLYFWYVLILEIKGFIFLVFGLCLKRNICNCFFGKFFLYLGWNCFFFFLNLEVCYFWVRDVWWCF